MGILSESSVQLGRSAVTCDFLNNTNMSDLPALHLFEEIQGLSNSTDFYNNNTSSFSGKSSPTRDTWDPMLYNINLTTYLDLNMDEDVQVRKQPMLETPITPLPGMEDLQVFLSVSHSLSEHAR